MDVKKANDLFKSAKKADLIKLIVEISKLNPELDKWIVNYTQKDTDKQTKNLREDELKGYFREIDKFVSASFKRNYVTSKEFSKTQEYINIAKDEFENNEYSWTFKKWFLDKISKNFCEYKILCHEHLLDLCHVLCKTKEEKIYFADHVSLLVPSIYRYEFADFYLEAGEDGKFIDLLSSTNDESSNNLRLYKYYKDNNNDEKALSTLEKFSSPNRGPYREIFPFIIEEFKALNSDKRIDNYVNKLGKDLQFDFYIMFFNSLDSSDYDNRKKYLFKIIETGNVNQAVEYFNLSDKILNEEDYKKYCLDILDIIRKKDVSTYISLLAEQNLLSELLDFYFNNYDEPFDNAPASFSNRQSCDNFCLFIWDNITKNINDLDVKLLIKYLYLIKKLRCSNKMTPIWRLEIKEFQAAHEDKIGGIKF
ncbi:MAG: hypothetical protein IJU40_07665 [Desulfovibrionaceae bacterium]|nr:hypothetical protein [Desulfovibrionaceae bacterium]